MALHDLGRLQEFEAGFALWQSDNPQGHEGIARIAAWTGDNELALQSLEEVVTDQGPEALVGTTTGGFYRKLKQDPRFDDMLRKYGQHPDQREKIPFNFTPPE